MQAKASTVSTNSRLFDFLHEVMPKYPVDNFKVEELHPVDSDLSIACTAVARDQGTFSSTELDLHGKYQVVLPSVENFVVRISLDLTEPRPKVSVSAFEKFSLPGFIREDPPRHAQWGKAFENLSDDEDIRFNGGSYRPVGHICTSSNSSKPAVNALLTLTLLRHALQRKEMPIGEGIPRDFEYAFEQCAINHQDDFAALMVDTLDAGRDMLEHHRLSQAGVQDLKALLDVLRYIKRVPMSEDQLSEFSSLQSDLYKEGRQPGFGEALCRLILEKLPVRTKKEFFPG